MFSGDVIILGTEHLYEVEIHNVNLSDTYKHYIETSPCFSDYISMM